MPIVYAIDNDIFNITVEASVVHGDEQFLVTEYTKAFEAGKSIFEYGSKCAAMTKVSELQGEWIKALIEVNDDNN